ncbi:acyl-CoA dehydrogenase [Actinoplanes philippinensis]|uniref:Acyl-CoA dehydrogenase n=1 Tax=Actinoplanes philippinensis TaxID=35752 RepID=A0A1I2EMS8_9ACTN|nr:acyl-CoA dehydrogenase family protein [Actinoplanes philippinensis]GIE82594.1 acyl-CoA dehydrogenase [Actinoplanes philippinensis]SFE93540.1 Acyl-CoA dehydrogenase [Actinoplanes philippinensis]
MTKIGSEASSLLSAVKDIVPALRANGQQAEDQRWLPVANLDLLEAAGVFRMATPRAFGGLDLSLREQSAVLAEIARGCPSSSWVSMVWVSSAWMVSLFPEELQSEVFKNPSVRISGGFSPTGTLVPAGDGYTLNGTWGFNSGCRGADWNMMLANVERPDGSVDEAVVLVPIDQFTVDDDWNASSLAATGSCTTHARDVHVPAHRVVIPAEAEAAIAAGIELPPPPPGRGYGLYSFLFSQAVATFVGIARGALEMFLERLPGRGISYTAWDDQAEHPVTQIQIGAAASRIAAAEALSEQMYELLQTRADAYEELTLEERGAVRGHSAYAVQLCKEAVEILYSASGASVIKRSVPLQRFHRDIQGLSLHGWIVLNTNLELYGRLLLGKDPQTALL